MIPLEIAKVVGLFLGIASGISICLLWRYLKENGLDGWKQRKGLLMIGLFLLTCTASFLLEYNRAPIVKRISYHMERPKGERGAQIPPSTQKMRIYQDADMGGFLSRPVYKNQVIGFGIAVSLLALLSMPKTKIAFTRATSKNGSKTLNIDKKAVLSRLESVLKEEELYTNPELNLDLLAERLKVSKYHLSQLINEELGLNFYALINDYRVDAAVKLMESGESNGHTLSSIGFEVGFNSKSSFYRAFKQRTGKTPAAFRKDLS